MNFIRLLPGSLLAACALSVGAAWPEKTINLIVPYPPGGLTDAVARQVGADRAAKSPADGYTLYIGNNATVGLNMLVYKKLSFDPLKDLAPVSLVAESQTVLVVHPSVPAKSVAELTGSDPFRAAKRSRFRIPKG